MKLSKKNIGFCKLCGEESQLTFEHIPPRVAFNKTTRYYSIPLEDYYTSENLLKFKPKGNVIQGGVGLYCLCKECNSFLGRHYVRAYSDFVNVGMNLVSRYQFDKILITVRNLNPLRILKQIASMFISISSSNIHVQCPEIIDFVRQPEKNELSEKYRFFMYLNNDGDYRKIAFPTITNQHGAISELAFPPFGFVLSVDIGLKLGIDSDFAFRQLTEITSFKNYKDNRENEFDILLNLLPTHFQLPLDYRDRNQIQT